MVDAESKELETSLSGYSWESGFRWAGLYFLNLLSSSFYSYLYKHTRSVRAHAHTQHKQNTHTHTRTEFQYFHNCLLQVVIQQLPEYKGHEWTYGKAPPPES